jgi:2-methylfumaryl-CoA isomerase
MFARIEQPGIGTFLTPGSPLQFGAVPELRPERAPILGEHTDEILTQILAMSDAEIARLHDERVVAGPS